eukprot:gene21334-23409_t
MSQLTKWEQLLKKSLKVLATCLGIERWCKKYASNIAIQSHLWLQSGNLIYSIQIQNTKVLPNFIRIDKGTETTTMSTIHAFLRGQQGDLHDPADSVIFGPSPSNQIERWWKELHECLEKLFKAGLLWLKEEGHYNPHDVTHRYAFHSKDCSNIAVMKLKTPVVSNFTYNNAY